MITITEMLAPLGAKCRPGRALTVFLGVTIHNTGNSAVGANATAHGKYLQGTGASTAASWHYAVDEKQAVRSVPESEVTWHAGDGSGNGNYKTVSIEICMHSDGDIRKATDNAVELAADILCRHGVTKAAGYLFQHNNWSGKNCPERIRAGIPYNWNTFVEKVQAHLDREGDEDMATRYNKVEELPKELQRETQELVDAGALAGNGSGLNITEDMARTMIVIKRYIDSLKNK